MIRNSFKIFIMLVVAGACVCGCYRSVESAPAGDSGNASGKGGSMARFTIVGDYLYTVNDTTLKTIDISNPAQPRTLPFKDQRLGFDVETIFNHDSLLFIGSRNAMYIYDVTRPEFPQYLSMTEHLRSCDPVVAAGGYAYMTLNRENEICWRGEDMLMIYDISDARNPIEVYADRSIYSPKGLGVDEAAARLFVCCADGMKIYDISAPQHPIWIDDLTGIKEINTSIAPYDVIPNRGLLIMTAREGLYQFDYTGDRLSFVSKIVTTLNEEE